MQNDKVKFKKRQRGVALLMVVFIMSIFLSAGTVLSIVFLRSLKSSQNLADSLIAFHAADSGLEHLIYLVRTQGEDVVLPGGEVVCDGDPNGFPVGNASCYVLSKKISGSIFVYAFGKVPVTVAKVSRSLGAAFTK